MLCVAKIKQEKRKKKFSGKKKGIIRKGQHPR
jgi:hypothetical protein